jgi:hypothetical protein
MNKNTPLLPVSNASTPLYLAIVRAEINLFFYLICRLSQFTVAVSLFRTLGAGFSSRRNLFDPTLFHVGFAVDKVAWRQIFSECFCLSLSE